MRPETKKRTPTGTKTRAAGIAMSETEQRKHKVTEEDKDCWRRTQSFFFPFLLGFLLENYRNEN